MNEVISSEPDAAYDGDHIDHLRDAYLVIMCYFTAVQASNYAGLSQKNRRAIGAAFHPANTTKAAKFFDLEDIPAL